MRAWWNERNRRRAEKLADERAEWERQWTRHARDSSGAAFALFRRIAEPLAQARVAEFTWDEQNQTMGLVTTDTSTTVVLLQILWPAWSDVQGDFRGPLRVTASSDGHVREVYAYDHITREWYPPDGDDEGYMGWAVELEACLRAAIQTRYPSW
jgi:hypothetical protein